jgi:hypothetical protein
VTARRRPWGACPTSKIRWRNRKAALAAIDTHRNRWRGPREAFPNLWVYRCPACKGWHFTSKPQEEAS